MASNIIIFDTSVFIDHLRAAKHTARISAVSGLIRNSAIVLSELLRGATKAGELAFIKSLSKNHPIMTPTEKNWIESGEVLGKIYRDKGFGPEKLRDLHFDVLIALSARNSSATIITSNRGDFELIKKYREFALEVW
jgi:predicted nucleic acid-binding protein